MVSASGNCFVFNSEMLINKKTGCFYVKVTCYFCQWTFWNNGLLKCSLIWDYVF